MEPENKKFIFCSFFIVLTSLILTVTVVLVEPQETTVQSVLFAILMFILASVIFFLLVPLTNIKIIESLNSKRWFYWGVVSLVVFLPLLSWIFSQDVVSALYSYLLWYILPTALMILPVLIKHRHIKRIDFIFHISAVVIFAIGFDNRYTYDVINGFDEMKYEFNALWMSALILLLFSIQLKEFTEKFNWKITLKKLFTPFIGLLILCLIAIPIDLITDFLVWSPEWPGFGMFVVSFIGIWLTIALPEETIARGIIQHQLTEKIVKKKSKIYPYWRWVAVVLASIAFAVTHWNNTSPELIWVYILLAAIAGVIYGVCWIFGGLFSAMLLHTLIDWIWALLLKAG